MSLNVLLLQTPPTVKRRTNGSSQLPGQQPQGFGTLPKDVRLNSLPPKSPHRSNSAEPPPPNSAAATHTYERNPRNAGTAPHPRYHAKQQQQQQQQQTFMSSPPSPVGTLRGASSTSTMTRKQNRVFASFGKGLLKLRGGKWSSSAPNLGDRQLHGTPQPPIPPWSSFIAWCSLHPLLPWLLSTLCYCKMKTLISVCCDIKNCLCIENQIVLKIR